jgi:hypothetical protein
MRIEDSDNKETWKLLLNALFGKMLQCKVYPIIDVIKDFAGFASIQEKFDINRIIPLVDEFSFVERERKWTTKVNPLQTAKSLLDRAKVLFLTRVYQVFERLAAYDVESVYQDTDSILFAVSEKEIDPENRLTQDQIFSLMGELLDTSNFDPTNPLFTETRKGQFGIWKSEVGDQHIREVVAVSPKVYSLVTENEYRVFKHKGVPAFLGDKMLTHAKFVDVIKNYQGPISVSYKKIAGENLQNYTTNVTKISLNRCNYKRRHVSIVESYPFGLDPEIEEEIRKKKEDDLVWEVVDDIYAEAGDMPDIMDEDFSDFMVHNM